jgi:hypothetical protein
LLEVLSCVWPMHSVSKTKRNGCTLIQGKDGHPFCFFKLSKKKRIRQVPLEDHRFGPLFRCAFANAHAVCWCGCGLLQGTLTSRCPHLTQHTTHAN